MGVDGVTLPADPIQSQPDAARPRGTRSRRSRRCGSCSTTARAATPGRPCRRASGSSFARSPLPGTAPRRGTSARRARSPTPRRPRPAPTASPGTRPPGRRPTSPATPAPAACGRRRPPTTGAQPGRHGAQLHDDAARADDRRRRRRRAVRVDPVLDAPTSTSRSRSPRSGPTARRCSCRAAGCAPACAGSTRRKSTELQPVLSLRRKHAEPLPKGKFARIAVPLYYQGHAYRAGSRIRVTISAPGGDQPVWAFANTRPQRGRRRSRSRTRRRGRRGSCCRSCRA